MWLCYMARSGLLLFRDTRRELHPTRMRIRRTAFAARLVQITSVFEVMELPPLARLRTHPPSSHIGPRAKNGRLAPAICAPANAPVLVRNRGEKRPICSSVTPQNQFALK